MKYDGLCVSALRALSIDAINKAKSGHPGIALDAAPFIYTLFTRHLVVDPKQPDWIKRDRFVLSAGHGSVLLYAALHLSGFDVTMDDLKNFRQLNSITPGHPELGRTPGVDITTGPLGQGLAQAVGFAIAEEHLRSIYPGSDDLFSHYTYVLCGDGDLEEGISHEAGSIAGTLKLSKLIVIYDSNNVTLDGPLAMSAHTNELERFKSYGWNTEEVADGNDVEALDKALREAKESAMPTFILMHTIIGYGSSNQGTAKTHGSPLGLEDGEHAKDEYGWKYPPFIIPDEVYLTFKDTLGKRGEKAYAEWEKAKEKYFFDHPQEANFLDATIHNDVSSLVLKSLPHFPEGEPLATRDASNQVLNLVQQELPNLIGGAADVASSLKTDIKGAEDFSPENPQGTMMRYGVREFAMGGIANGLMAHGGLRTYCGTFLAFSDYMKGAIRLSALQHLPVLYLFSHDSIAVGEDGPTHQPVEQVAALRSIPNLYVFRPCDGTEVAAAYRMALRSVDKPTCIILTRQKLPYVFGTSAQGVERGGYVVSKENRRAAFTLIASGSEVSLAIQAQKSLLGDGIDVRVVSLPEMNLFLAQPQGYRDEVLANPRGKRLMIEMESSFGLYALADQVMGIDSFGLSGKGPDVIKAFGFTPDNVAHRVKKILGVETK